MKGLTNMKYTPRIISNQTELKVFGFYDKHENKVYTGYISRYNGNGSWCWSVQKGYMPVNGDKVSKDIACCLHTATCVLNDFITA
jgi:hypothetical protein